MAKVHWRTFLESNVLRFVDIPEGRDVTVKIKKIEKGKVVGSGGKSTGKAMIYFDGKEKPLAAGTAILSTIETLYGDDTRTWPGKSVTLYADPSVVYGGKAVGGIRIRPVVPADEAVQK